MTHICLDRDLDIFGCICHKGKTYTASHVQLVTVVVIPSEELPPQLCMDGLDKIVLFPNEHRDYEFQLF